MIQKNNTSKDKESRFNLGIQAFQRIMEIMDRVSVVGHKARKRYKDKTIIEYLGILETLYVKVGVVLKHKDRIFIEDEIKELKKDIDAYNKKVSGNQVKLVSRLTELERRFYDAIQDINMYIQLKHDYSRQSKKMDFKNHLEGSEIPEFDEEYE